jgi:Ca2+-binding RTX toxin-like protein
MENLSNSRAPKSPLVIPIDTEMSSSTAQEGGTPTSFSQQSFSRIIGSPQDDLIFDGAGDSWIDGTAGADTIYGEGGSDYLLGGADASPDYLYGGDGADTLAGGGGPDRLYGGNGDDEIRAGSGKDTISGGAGADILYGGGGTNVFLSEADGSIDQLYVMSDFRGHAYDWGRNHGGINADVITELDTNDRITILGTSDSSLTYRSVAAGTYNQSQAGIGIFDGDSLEALYIGTNLNAFQLDAITSGDPTRFS